MHIPNTFNIRNIVSPPSESTIMMRGRDQNKVLADDCVCLWRWPSITNLHYCFHGNDIPQQLLFKLNSKLTFFSCTCCSGGGGGVLSRSTRGDGVLLRITVTFSFLLTGLTDFLGLARWPTAKGGDGVGVGSGSGGGDSCPIEDLEAGPLLSVGDVL